MPTFFNATTEFSDTTSPVRAATPAEITLTDRHGSGCAASACCSKAAAIGLRQMLAVHTATMVAGADISARKGHAFPRKAKPDYRGRRRSDFLQRHERPVQMDRTL